MAISTKFKRRIQVGGRDYYWYRRRDHRHPFEPGSWSIFVGSIDLKFMVRYPLFQPDDNRHLIVLGPEFGGYIHAGPSRRFQCPRFGDENMVVPKDIRNLIDWCHKPLRRTAVDEAGALASDTALRAISS